jgi:hypothetical protein
MVADKFLGIEMCYFNSYITWCLHDIQSVVEDVSDILWCRCVVFAHFFAHISMMSDVIAFFLGKKIPKRKESI